MVCGNGKEPLTNCSDYSSQVSGYSGVKLENGYWYKLKDITLVDEDTDKYSDSVKLEVYNNSTISIIGHDGNEFLDGKSTQMTFKSNPYVVLNISHSKYDDFKGSFLGGDNEVPFYPDNWMSVPTISWQVYGGYETKSYVYYSNSTDNYDSRGTYNTSNVVSGYNGKTTCNDSDKCYINADNFTNGGMQEIGIVVVNVATKKETIIRVQVNIDKKAPNITIVNDSGGNWTNKEVITTVNYDDVHSGINPNTLSWSKGGTSYTTYTDNASNKSSRVDTWLANSTWAGEYIAYYKICDNADNCSTVNTPIKIDITKPTLVANLTANGATYTIDTWTKYNVVRKLTTSDSGGSKVDRVQYQNNCTGSWNDLSSNYVSSYTYSTTGNLTNKMCLKVKDVAGNESDSLTLIVKIDKVNPTKPTTMSFVHGGWYDYDGSWTNKTVYVARLDGKSDSSKRGPTGSTDTGGSGIVKYQISSNGSTWVDYSYSTSNSLYVMSTTGTYTRYFRAVDGVGNVSDALEVSAYVDKTAPTNLSIYNPKEGVWTNTSFKLTLTASDANSGIGYYQYTYSDSASSTGDDNTTEWVTYANSAKTSFTTTAFSAQRNQAVYVRVCDKVGNCSDKKSTMIMIDTTPPTGPTDIYISNDKIYVESGTDTGGSNWKNDRISFYGPDDTTDTDDKHYPNENSDIKLPVPLSEFTSTGSYWVSTSTDDNAGNNSRDSSYVGMTKTLTIANKVTSSWYECSSGYVSGSYCINYYNVSSSTSCESCSVYGGTCSVCIRYAECPSACKKSYYTAASCNNAGYVWSGTGSFCWGYGTYYKTITSCDQCGSTTTYSCPSGWKYSSSGGYCYKSATAKSGTSCADGYTEGSTGLCYKLS